MQIINNCKSVQRGVRLLEQMHLTCSGRSSRLSHNTRGATAIRLPARISFILADWFLSPYGMHIKYHLVPHACQPVTKLPLNIVTSKRAPRVGGGSWSKRSAFNGQSSLNFFSVKPFRAYLKVYKNLCGAISLFPLSIQHGLIWKLTDF